MKIRAVIVDDEPLARDRLRALLAAHADVEVVGEFCDGPGAVTGIRELEPDLVFLDIQMPGMDGFGVLEALGDERLPVVIFVTAFDRFAVRAFEVHAVDYLLKPFDRERLGKAIDRARAARERSDAGQDLRQRLDLVLNELGRGAARAADRIAIKAEGRILLLRMEDIDWIEAADNYVSIHAGSESHLHRETMTSLESRLSPEKFVRISRSTIVNIDRIKELQPLFHGDYVVLLRGGPKLTMSRNYRERLSHLLGKQGG